MILFSKKNIFQKHFREKLIKFKNKLANWTVELQQNGHGLTFFIKQSRVVFYDILHGPLRICQLSFEPAYQLTSLFQKERKKKWKGTDLVPHSYYGF